MTVDSADTPTPSVLQSEDRRAGVKLSGRYRLVSLNSRGDLTEVWRAEDEVLGRTVAAKILRTDRAADGGYRRRFRTATLAAARLTHPNICSVFDTGEFEDTPFIVMEYMPGGTLKDRLGEASLDAAGAAEIGSRLCGALDHAHRQGIVHGDLKPENVLFTESGYLKVSDFALAGAMRLGEQSQERRAAIASSPYLAPEQKLGRGPDARSDLYSLGMILSELAAQSREPAASPASDPDGTAASPAAAPDGTAAGAASAEESDDPSRLFARAVAKATAINPDDRFSSAEELQKALVEIVGKRLGQAAQMRAAAQAEARPGGVRSAAVAGKPRRVRAEPVAPMVDQDPDPPSDSFLRTEGRWLLPTIAVILAAIALVLAVPAVRNTVGDVVRKTTSLGIGRTASIPVASQQPYDPPPGDGQENNAKARLAFDDDPSSYWATTSYRTAEFGNLKPGVGLAFDLGSPKQLSKIDVKSVTGGWQGSIRYSDDGTNFSDPPASQTAGQDHVFEVTGTHRYWMLWITRLVVTSGEGNGNNSYSVGIADIDPQGKP
jgi:hypothetical protein